jgi:hypothetical protein
MLPVEEQPMAASSSHIVNTQSKNSIQLEAIPKQLMEGQKDSRADINLNASGTQAPSPQIDPCFCKFISINVNQCSGEVNLQPNRSSTSMADILEQ